jgi:hypothetical protein
MFHGTAAKNIQPILEGGFVIPKAGGRVQMAHGAAYGPGIYLGCSPAISAGCASLRAARGASLTSSHRRHRLQPHGELLVVSPLELTRSSSPSESCWAGPRTRST